MCELFAMSSLRPTNVTFSLDEFAKHGGLTGPHKDGWGIAYYEDGDVRIVREANAASDSSALRFVREHDYRSTFVISHIRHATQGRVALKNTQPFCRELGGRMHAFVHNGDLVGLQPRDSLNGAIHRPVGETDSEYAFCLLLLRIESLWLDSDTPPLSDRLEVVERFAEEMRTHGPANFIYCDSDSLFVHGHTRRHASGEQRPPGVFTLCRTCSEGTEHEEIKGLGVESIDQSQAVVLAASVPLSDERWVPMEEGEVAAIRRGYIVKSVTTR